ncbi:MAG: hypothetical protein P9X26_04825 [Candidatus Stygibacter frigidus]|nr:hypothetical protein [Candidatus Stygibacter frigidus]
MIVISDFLYEQSDQFRQLASSYGLHLPYFYLKEGMISKSALIALRRRYRVTILPAMDEADHVAAELLHYNCRKISICEARMVVLAKKHKISYLMHDAVLHQVCKAEGVIIVDHIDS